MELFQYTASKLAEAIQTKVDWHTERLDWWLNNNEIKKMFLSQEKVLLHAHLLNEYSMWLQILSQNPKNNLSLDADDYEFFFGTNDAEVEEN